MIGIYKITSPTNKIYIGQSVDIDKRFKHYNNSSSRAQIRIYNSLKKYGLENHVFEVIEECSIEQLNERERYWQEYYDVLGKNGLNCVLTKTDDKSGFMRECTKKRMSLSRKNLKKSESHKKNIGKAHKGRVFSYETKEKMRISRSGFKHSKESIEIIRLNSTGRKHSDEAKLKCRNANLGKVLSDYTKRRISDSKKGKSGIKHTQETKDKISKANLGRKFKDTYNFGNRNRVGRIVFNIYTGIYYDSVSLAAESCNMNASNLYDQLSGVKNRVNKTEFRFI